MTIVGTVWAPIGPSPITDGTQQNNGMVTAIAVNPNDGNVIYIGTAEGGVWKTIDGGDNWRSLFDRQPSLGIGEPMAVAIDPSNTTTIYVGSSARGRVSPGPQAGLFKSIDGGASWISVGSGFPAGNTGNATRFNNDSINAIIVDPANSATLYLASTSGVYRSTDSGQNWTRGANTSGDARSLVLDRSSPATARILYAGISTSGVIRSNDGGRNWTQILSATTPAVATALAAVAGTTMNQVVLDLAPPTSPPAAGGVQVLYVAIAGSGPKGVTFPDPVGLFMSTNQGATWTRRAATGLSGTTFSGYCLAIAVDPASPGNGANDTIYFGTNNQARSTNSGAAFSAIMGLHSDTHAWAFFRPPAPATTVVYVGTDGGLSRSTNGTTFIPRNTGGLQTGLVYNIDLRPDATASQTVGALQDNRVEISGTLPGWTTVAGGDGWDAVYDGTTANQLFASTNNNAAPQTRVQRSTNGGGAWTDVTPWASTTTGPEAGFFLSSLAADPSGAGIIYAASNRNLYQTRNGGGSWRNIGSFPTADPNGFLSAKVSVAPSNGNNVVVANGPSVSVSTNALATSGVTFTPTPNLPGRSVLRAEFDPNDSTVIYAVLGGFAGGGPAGHVFRTTIGATAWTDISPNLDAPHSALALDGADTPTTIYVGTDLGILRSVDNGASWYVLDALHLPNAPVTDLVIGRGSRILRAATYGRGVFEFSRPAGPSIAVNPEKGLDFGTVCGTQYLTLDIFNVGSADLVINSVQRLMGSAGFVVLPAPGTPLVIGPGEEVDFTIQFTPTTPGSSESATIRIVSSDPGAPVVDLLAKGTAGVPALEVVLPDNGDFGKVCLGSFVDRDITINNRGDCPLRITGISATPAASFITPAVSTFPLLVDAGDSIEVPVRFQPVALGPAAASLRITSNDPASPKVVRVTGDAPAPRLSISIANSGDFGDVCVGSIKDEELTLNSSGACPLAITAITSSSTEFIPPEVKTFPLLIAAGSSLEVEIRFEPTSFGPKSATITITSDDPSGPMTLSVTGTAPSGHLAVTGSGHFGAVDLGRRAERTLSICNTGKCDLHVKRVVFKPDPRKAGCRDCDDCDCEHELKRHHRHEDNCDQCCSTFKIENNPFPATVHAGSCLGVLIRFVPDCGGPKCCELVIESDDPSQPEKTVFVTGRLHRTLKSALKCWAAAELHELLEAGEEC